MGFELFCSLIFSDFFFCNKLFVRLQICIEVLETIGQKDVLFP